MEAKERNRLEEVRLRNEKIEKVMTKMGDVIVHRDKELQRQQEREYIQQCIEKDNQAHLQDMDKKRAYRQKQQEVCRFLDNQVYEKKQMKKNYDDTNTKFMEAWTK